MHNRGRAHHAIAQYRVLVWSALQFVPIDGGSTLWVAVKEMGDNLFLQLFEASLVVCSGAGPWWTLVMLVLDCGAKHIMGVATASL